MPASIAEVAYEWELWIGRTVAGVTTWTEVLGIETLPFPVKVPETFDRTHMKSPGRTREAGIGLIPFDETDFEKQMWAGHAGDQLLNELAQDYARGVEEDVLMEFNTGGATPDVRRTFRGRITGYTPSGTVGDKAMVSVGMLVFELQTTNPRTI